MSKKETHKPLIIEQLKKIPVVQVVCEKVGVSRSTYYRWRDNDKDFAKKSNRAIEEGNEMINDLAESQLISAIKDRNMTSIIFWLKRRHPAFKKKVDVTGEIKHSKKELSDEEKELIQQAIKLAKPEEPIKIESKQENNKQEPTNKRISLHQNNDK